MCPLSSVSGCADNFDPMCCRHKSCHSSFENELANNRKEQNMKRMQLFKMFAPVSTLKLPTNA